MTLHYDIIVIGGGIAGLWVANTLKNSGYNVILVEKEKLGSGQTMASQGMIHGGQKYLLEVEGRPSDLARKIAKMPERWDSCFEGRGEVDLKGVRCLSGGQVMWPAGEWHSATAMLAAAESIGAKMKRLREDEFPIPLREKKELKERVYQLPEKVLEVRSLIERLALNLEGQLLHGEITELQPEGRVALSGYVIRAQLIVIAAGSGNEQALKQLNVSNFRTQRRSLRQIMVRTLPEALYGHGVTDASAPRLTVTSHPAEGGYIWYLGGAIADEKAEMDKEDALEFARKELQEIFPEIDWRNREWATWCGDRAEPDEEGKIPSSPKIHECDRTLLAWPTKLTFAPALSDLVFKRLKEIGIHPEKKTAPPSLPRPAISSYPWETATWQRRP